MALAILFIRSRGLDKTHQRSLVLMAIADGDILLGPRLLQVRILRASATMEIIGSLLPTRRVTRLPIVSTLGRGQSSHLLSYWRGHVVEMVVCLSLK